jgi:hypothetical protein
MVASVCNTEVNEGTQLPCRTWRAVGMTFAMASDDRFNTGRGGATWVLPAGTFTGIDTADRQALSDWMDGAIGIDAVMDFSVRPWNVAGTNAIFGAFEAGNDQAAWLIVRHGPGWMLVRCADGFVSDVSVSLRDILDLIDEQRRA